LNQSHPKASTAIWILNDKKTFVFFSAGPNVYSSSDAGLFSATFGAAAFLLPPLLFFGVLTFLGSGEAIPA
jgi:hypothetical protein